MQTVSPALSAIPFVGGALSGLASFGGGLLEQQGAKQQAEQAKREREAALRTQKQALRPEFIQKRNMDTMMALSGLAGYNEANALLDANVANQARAIRESSGSGAQTLAAISAANAIGNENKMKLSAQNMAAKQAGLQRLGETVWGIGEKQRQLEDIRDMQKQQGLQAANALEKAATFNRVNAAKQMMGAISGGVNQIGTTALMQDEAAQNRALIQALMGNQPQQPNPAVPNWMNVQTGSQNLPTAPNMQTGNTLNLPANSFWGNTPTVQNYYLPTWQ